MNAREFNTLLAEAGELNLMLTATPEQFALNRMSLKSRLNEINGLLSMYPQGARRPARSKITFRGKPVVGSHGIFADFGAEAVSKFTDAVSMWAASLSAPLQQTGPIPNRDQNRILITNVALGSFGFELEEDLTQGEVQTGESSAVENALESIHELLESTIGTDDQLSEIVSEVDGRVVAKMREYLEIVAKAEAVCAFEYRDRVFSYKDVDQVRRSADRLRDDNVHTEIKTFRGTFEGAIPNRRAFEFKLADSNDVIYGKVDSAVENVDKINDIRHKQLEIQLRAKWVGAGKPRFTLMEIPEL